MGTVWGHIRLMSLFFFLFKAGDSDRRTYSLPGGTAIYTAILPAEANIIWSITGNASGSGRAVGYVQKDEYDSGDAIAFTNFSAWTTPLTGWGQLYVRLTAISGTADSPTHAIDGSTWHSFQEGVTNIAWTETHNGSPSESCTVRVEIATDSGGTHIVATGDYTSEVTSEP